MLIDISPVHFVIWIFYHSAAIMEERGQLQCPQEQLWKTKMKKVVGTASNSVIAKGGNGAKDLGSERERLLKGATAAPHVGTASNSAIDKNVAEDLGHF